MEIHQKFDSAQEYKKFFLELISWTNSNKSLWRTEDLPLLEPFFSYSKRMEYHTKHYEMTEEQRRSFDYYTKCLKDYGDKNREMRDALSAHDESTIADAFRFEVDDCYTFPDHIEEDWPVEYRLDEDLEFPLFVTGFIESGFDRFGNTCACIIRFVTLKDLLGNE